MTFSSAQIRKLQREVKACDIRTREVNGRELAYIEGWHAISEANRIFGFDAWSRETVDSRCVSSREVRGTFHALYIAKVRVTVRAEAETVIREGFGTGEAQGATPGEAHDKAIKTAETDATKRAFATFGKPFGLSLYLTSRKQSKSGPDIERRRTLQRLGSNGRYQMVPRPKQPPLDPALRTPNPKVNMGDAETLLSLSNTDKGERGVTLQQDDPDPSPHGQLQSKNTLQTDDAYCPAKKVSSADQPIQLQARDGFIASGSGMLIEKTVRHRDRNHLKYVAGQPCLICSRTPSDPHHLKFAQPRAMAKKVSDEFTVPLCRTHHRQLHHAGDEIAWWIDLQIDPLPIAKDLWRESHANK
jgi:hypothetical protein